jgi:hypothetical protein
LCSWQQKHGFKTTVFVKKQVNHLSKKDPTLPVVQLLDGWTVELFGSHKDCFFKKVSLVRRKNISFKAVAS